jgi:hypothetical protein
MPSQTTDTTEDGAPQLASIVQRYEQAKACIAGVPVPAGSDGQVHDTVAVDIRLPKPPLVAAHRRTDGAPGRESHRPEDRTTPVPAPLARGRRLWHSLRTAWSAGRSQPAA